MDKDIQTLGLIPKQSGWDGHPWASRDWVDVDCKAIGCRYNSNEKCGVPSRANFDETAKCSGFELRESPKKIDGD